MWSDFLAAIDTGVAAFWMTWELLQQIFTDAVQQTVALVQTADDYCMTW